MAFGSLTPVNFTAPDSLVPQTPIDGSGLLAPHIKSSFFGQGGTGRSIAGYIGDALLSLSGNRPIYAQAMQNQLEDKRVQERALLENQLAIAREAAARADKAAHPDPTNTENVYNFLHAKNPALGNMYLQNTAQGAPVAVDVANPDGTTSRTYQRPGAMQPSGPPPGAIAMLRQNPSLAPQFEQKYGQGSAGQYLGGAASQGAGSFR